MVYSFGPFQLDEQSRRLTRNGELVAISDRHVSILLELVGHAGQVVSKDVLIEAAWKDVAVTDNSLEQAISTLRRILGGPSDPPKRGTPKRTGETTYIETLARRGYRFRGALTVSASRQTDEALAALLAPHRAFVEGRAALETLDREAVGRARTVFAEITRSSPDYAPAHLGMANALALHWESTRADSSPDASALSTALHHASEACRLDPSSGEAWATLGLLYHQSRDTERAIASVRRASALEPENWRHHLRLAYVSWGEERLRAAHRVLKLLPDFPFAHWLAATVHVARQAFAEAERELVAGAAAQDRQHKDTPFRAVGLHLLLGLVRLAEGDERAAGEHFACELEFGEAAHIYTREACANTWCAIGAIRLRHMQTEAALAAFDHAISLVSGHPVAIAARAAAAGPTQRLEQRTTLQMRLRDLRERGAPVEAAVAEAVYETVDGHAERAAGLMRTALENAPIDGSAWVVPVDPLLDVSADLERWAPVLALLRSRAA